jgi:hypothetical protein
MLQLRPSCENCSTPLPPESPDARICSYECTFCVNCVDNVVHNVCPNCGGNFVPRPIRPARHWKGGNFLGNDPATVKVTYKPVDKSTFAPLLVALRDVPPDER